MTIPTLGSTILGRTVLYTLSQQDADAINKRRADAQAHIHEHRDNSSGVQIHFGNSAAEGDVCPMMIVRRWGITDTSCVNGQVFLDGNDLLWVTSVAPGTGPRTFAW